MSLEQKKIYEIATPKLENLDRNQIGFETTPDPDLCYSMWGGKSPGGTKGTSDGLSRWLAKDRRARVSQLTIQDMENGGIVVCDKNGRTRALKKSDSGSLLLQKYSSSDPSFTEWLKPGQPGNLLNISSDGQPKWSGYKGNGAETYFLENIFSSTNHYNSQFDHGNCLLINGNESHIKICRGESISGRISIVAIRYDNDDANCFSCYDSPCLGFCYDSYFEGLSSRVYEYSFHLMRMGHGQLAYYDPVQMYSNEYCENGWLRFTGLKWGFNDRVDPGFPIDIKLVPVLESYWQATDSNKTKVCARVDLIRATAPEKGSR